MAFQIQQNKVCRIENPRKSEYAYTLNGYNLKQETTQKDLGVTISDDLKPATHIQEIVKKANQRNGIMRCFTGLTQTKVRTLYHAIVRPILEYRSPVWNPNLFKDINALEKVQDKCSKLTSPPLTLQKLSDRRWQVDMCEVTRRSHIRIIHAELQSKAEIPVKRLRGITQPIIPSIPSKYVLFGDGMSEVINSLRPSDAYMRR